MLATLLCALVACLGTLATAEAAAPNPSPLPGSAFQAADGNQLAEGGFTDWQTYAGGIATTTPDGTAPDTFYDGKIDEPNLWGLSSVNGGITPAKANAQASTTFKDPLTSDLFFYFSFIREEDSNSETLFALELRKLTTTWTNSVGTVVPCRSNGDILFTYNVDPNDKNVELEAFRWTSGTGPAACPEGATGTYAPVNLGINAQGYMNFAIGNNTPNPISNFLRPDLFGATLATGRFGEGAINLTDTIGAGSNPCFSFGQAQFFSLASGGSFSSSMQDMIAPSAIDVRNCSSTGTKWRDLDADGIRDAGEPGIAGWTFWVDYDDDGVIDANEPSGISKADGSYSIDNVNPTASGYDPNLAYRIHERAPAGVTGFTCSFPATSDAHGCYASATFSTSGNQGPFDFGNVPPGKVVIKKANVGGTQTDAFNFTATGLTPATFATAASSATGQEYAVVLPNAGGPAVTGGPYTVTEDAAGQPAGYRLTNIVCDDADSVESVGTRSADIKVSPGETVTCTYTNTKDAQITVKKYLVPGATTGFDLLVGGAVEADNVGDDGTTGVVAKVPGTYAVAEALDATNPNTAADYVSTFLCSPTAMPTAAQVIASGTPGTSTSVNATAGSTTFCAFRNVRKAKVTIVKDAVPDDAQNFTFTSAGTLGAASFPLDDDADATVSNTRVYAGLTTFGTTTVRETQITDWDLESIICTNGTGAAVAAVKFGTGDGAAFSTGAADASRDGFDLGDTAVQIDVQPGVDVTCTYANKKVALNTSKLAVSQTVNAGENIGFTIVTDNQGPGVARGVTLNDPLPTGVTWAITAQTNPGECSIAAGPPQVLSCSYGDLPAGATRSVTVTATTSETACAVYTNTATVTSTNASPDQSSDSVTCNQPNLSIDKTPDAQIVDAGAPISFSMVTSNGGPGTAKAVTLSDPLPAGVAWTIDPAAPGCAITGAVGSQTLNCTYGDLLSGATRTVTVTAQTTETACAVYDNTATIDASNAPAETDAGRITCRKPDLKVTKVSGPSPVDAGDAVSFTMVTSNDGPGLATGVTLSDPLPAGLTWTISSQSLPAACSIVAQLLSCSYGDLAAGQSRTVTVTATTSFTACGTYPNTATADASNAPAVTADATVICRGPDLSIVKTPNSQNVSAGDPISFQMVTSNGGLGTAKGVTLSDTLPTGVTWAISAQTNAGECSIAAGPPQVLSCTYGDLGPGATRSVTITATTSETACGTYDNLATVNATNAPSESDAGQITCRRPDLSVVKTAAAGTVDAGDPISFTVVTENAGPGIARSVTIDDPLPAGVTWSISSQSAPAACSITAGPPQTLVCGYGDLASGASRTVTVTAQTSETACATYSNIATVDATNAPAETDDASITCNLPDLGVDKAAVAVTVDAGDDVSFTMVTTNTGPGTAKAVTLTDPLPTGVTWAISAQTNAGECSIAAGPPQVLTCAYGDLASGATRSVTVKATTSETACAVYNNTATVDATNAPADSDGATISCNLPDLSIVKTPDAQIVDAGDALSFSMVTTNGGPGLAKGVTLSDPLPAGVAWTIDPAAAGCAITGAVGSQTLNCTYGDLLSGATRTVTVTAQTTETACAVYDNTATIDASNAPAETDAGRITCRKPDLSIVKTPDAQIVDAGDALSFSMVTTNGGPGLAKGVTLSDPLPAGVAWTIDPAAAGCAITGAVGSQTLNCSYGDLAANATRTVTVTAQTTFTDCAVYDNTATIDATNAPAETDAGRITCNRPDLGTDKAALQVVVDAGDAISFDITTTNAGPGVAKDVVLNDPLPAGVDWTVASQSNPGECAISGVVGSEVLTCAYGNLAAGASRTVRVAATTTGQACATYDNTVTVGADNAPDDTDGATITCNKPDVTIEKSTSTGQITGGQVAKFQVTVKNAGPGTAKNVTVGDLLPAGPIWVADGALPAGCSIGDVQVNGATRQQVTCTFASLGVTTVTFGVQGQTTVTVCDTYVNTGTVTGTNFPDGSATATVVCVKPLPQIAIVKDGPATAVAGAGVLYTMNVSNPGPTPFPDGLVRVDDPQCEAPPALVSRNGDASPGTLDPGDRWTYTCTVRTLVGQASVRNVATVTGTDVNGNPATATDDAVTTLSQPVVAAATVTQPQPQPAAVKPGSAKLRGPNGCLSGSIARTWITGKQIKQVRFTMDGRTIRTVTKADKQGRWLVSVPRKKLTGGAHRVMAIVTFTTASRTKQRKLQLRFSVCGQVLPSRAKGFTG